MSKGGGKTQTVTQVTNSAPWAPQQEYLKDGFKRASDWFNDSDTPSYYPESTVVPFSPQTEQALRMAETRALSNDPLVQKTTNLLSGVAGGQWVGKNPANQTFRGMVADRGTGVDALKATASGQMINQNPHLQGVIGNATEAIRDDFMKTVVPGLQGAFGKAGRVGSNSHASAINDSTETLADAMSETAANIQYQDYSRERANQLSAAERLMSDGNAGAQAMANLNAQERAQQLAAGQQLPAMAQHEWDQINRLAAVGASREQLANAQLQDKVARFNFEQTKEPDKIGQYLSLVGGGYGTSGTSSQPYFYNPASNILSGATSGAALASMMKVNPMWGAAAGGILGAF